MKFVYVLISSSNDYYAEQALVSIYSLRKHNRNSSATLVTDKDTKNYLESTNHKILDYINEWVIPDVPQEFSAVQKSRFLKTTLRKNVRGTFLYLDNDTIITAALDELKNLTCDVAAILDGNAILKHHSQIESYLKKTGKEFWGESIYYNGGVFFSRDTEVSRNLFEDWYFIWNQDREKFGLSLDQPSFAQANKKNGMIIKELPGVYNCQIMCNNAREYMFNAKIVHYYSNYPDSINFPLNIQECLLEIRETGITPRIERIIDNPILGHIKNSIIISGEEYNLYTSPIVILARKLSRDFPFTNKLAKLAYRLFGFRL